MKLENVTIEIDETQKVITIHYHANSSAHQMLLEHGVMNQSPYPMEEYTVVLRGIPAKRQPNLHHGAITFQPSDWSNMEPEEYQAFLKILEEDRRPTPEQIAKVHAALALVGDDTFIHAPLQARNYEHNVVATSGKEAHFSGDATLDGGGCGYCSKQELFLNGRSLSSIVAFIQETDPCLCEPFQVTIDIRPAPRKD